MEARFLVTIIAVLSEELVGPVVTSNTCSLLALSSGIKELETWLLLADVVDCRIDQRVAGAAGVVSTTTVLGVLMMRTLGGANYCCCWPPL